MVVTVVVDASDGGIVHDGVCGNQLLLLLFTQTKFGKPTITITIVIGNRKLIVIVSFLLVLLVDEDEDGGSDGDDVVFEFLFI